MGEPYIELLQQNVAQQQLREDVVYFGTLVLSRMNSIRRAKGEKEEEKGKHAHLLSPQHLQFILRSTNEHNATCKTFTTHIKRGKSLNGVRPDGEEQHLSSPTSGRYQ